MTAAGTGGPWVRWYRPRPTRAEDLEAWLADATFPSTIERLESISHRLPKLGMAPRYVDDLPADTP